MNEETINVENYDSARYPSIIPLKRSFGFRPPRTTGDFDSLEMIDSESIPEYKTLQTSSDSTEFVKLDEIATKAKTELEEYLNLPHGWDGYDGEKFDEELIKKTISIVDTIVDFFKDERRIPIEMIPGPASDGSVDLEIGFKNKYIIITLYPDEESMTVYLEHNEKACEEEVLIGKQALEAKLLWLVN